MDLLFCACLLWLRKNIKNENIGVCSRSKRIQQIHFTYIHEMCNLVLLHFKITLVVATIWRTVWDSIVVVRVFLACSVVIFSCGMYSSCVQDVLLNFISKLMVLPLKGQCEGQAKFLLKFLSSWEKQPNSSNTN